MLHPKKFLKISPTFIPSILSSTEEEEKKQAKLQAKRLKTTVASIALHILLVPIFLSLFVKKADTKPDEIMVVISNTPFYLPNTSQKEGGGGGGGGKKEKPPPESGRLPETVRPKLVAPDPQEPQPLIPPEIKDESNQKIVTPIEIPQDLGLPVGDIQAPPNEQKSSGPGTGGGVGTGKGEGSGSGSGAGGGSGSGGGVGSGSGGGIGDGVGPFAVGNGVTEPIPVFQPLPEYTEEARQLRIEGIVLLEAVVRKDGRVDSLKVIRGLGHGLNESAIKTITERWHFRPGTFKGKPANVQVQIEITFRLL